MKKSTLKALEGSIIKWEGIVAGIGVDNGVDNCPLCQKFADPRPFTPACGGCPVREAAGIPYCRGTPYEEWVDLFDNNDYPHEIRDSFDKPRAKVIAKKELEFLKSLLPKGEKK